MSSRVSALSFAAAGLVCGGATLWTGYADGLSFAAGWFIAFAVVHWELWRDEKERP